MIRPDPTSDEATMRTTHWTVIAVSLLAAGLLYVHVNAAPVPEPVARAKVGRYTMTRAMQLRTNDEGRQVSREFGVMLDTATGRVWVLEQQQKGAKPMNKWVLAGDAPK
jgi:hypothetical protein